MTKRHTKSSQANSTPVTDGRHIVAVFGSIGMMVCYDMDGTLLWKKEIGAVESGWFLDPSYQWGHSSSPVIYKSSVIVQADQAQADRSSPHSICRRPRAVADGASRRGVDVGDADDPPGRKATSSSPTAPRCVDTIRQPARCCGHSVQTPKSRLARRWFTATW